MATKGGRRGITDRAGMVKAARQAAREKARPKVERIPTPGVKKADTPVDAPSPGLADPVVRRELLDELRVKPILTAACRVVGVTYQELLAYRRASPEFDREIDDARLEGWELVEERAFDEAAHEGFRASRMREFLLKGRKRHVYGDRLDVHSQHTHEVVINLIPPGELARPLAAGEVVDAEVVSVVPDEDG